MKRPWNIIDAAVYSLATYHNDILNMNICTYVTAISMQPKLYAIAVYNHTKTLDNLLQPSSAVLQLLHKEQYKLVKMLGKKEMLQSHGFVALDKATVLACSGLDAYYSTHFIGRLSYAKPDQTTHKI